MSELKTKIRYDFNLLTQYCEKNGIKLTNDYSKEKVVNYTVIVGKCLKCEEICSKTFRLFMSTGCFCKIHTFQNGKEKSKATNLTKYGSHPLQNKEVQEKRKATNLMKYGCEYTMQNKEIKEKFKATNFTKYGSHPSQNKEVQKKMKETNLMKYGCEYTMQNKEIKEKSKATNFTKYGSHPLQNKEVQEKRKATNLIKYGSHPSQHKEVQKKMKETNLIKFGYEYTTQNKEVQEKVKATFLKKYGSHPLQNAEVSAKSSKNAYKSYDYTFPSGRVERIQGYEKYMLNDLLQKENISEDDIIVKRTEVPSVWYEDLKGKKHRYFVDCFIKSQNRCIEAKSTWTAEKQQDCIYLKQQALKDAGYLCEIWIYDNKGQIINKF